MADDSTHLLHVFTSLADDVISGLRKVLKEGESVPEIFEDPVVKRASHWVLSTSALFSKHLREYGWGEVRLFTI
jgi:carnitine O-acetyltransferase